MAARLAEAEQSAEAANAKASGLEKAKNRLQGELDDLLIEVERVSRIYSFAKALNLLFDLNSKDFTCNRTHVR